MRLGRLSGHYIRHKRMEPLGVRNDRHEINEQDNAEKPLSKTVSNKEIINPVTFGDSTPNPFGCGCIDTRKGLGNVKR